MISYQKLSVLKLNIVFRLTERAEYAAVSNKSNKKKLTSRENRHFLRRTWNCVQTMWSDAVS